MPSSKSDHLWDTLVASDLPALLHLSLHAARTKLGGYLACIVEVEMEEAGQ